MIAEERNHLRSFFTVTPILAKQEMCMYRQQTRLWDLKSSLKAFSTHLSRIREKYFAAQS